MSVILKKIIIILIFDPWNGKGFLRDFIFRCDFYVLFGVIKNSEGLFSLFAEFLREGGKNRVGDASLTHGQSPSWV